MSDDAKNDELAEQFGAPAFTEQTDAAVVSAEVTPVQLVIMCKPCRQPMQGLGPDAAAKPDVIFMYRCPKCGKGAFSREVFPRVVYQPKKQPILGANGRRIN